MKLLDTGIIRRRIIEDVDQVARNHISVVVLVELNNRYIFSGQIAHVANRAAQAIEMDVGPDPNRLLG